MKGTVKKLGVMYHCLKMACVQKFFYSAREICLEPQFNNLFSHLYQYWFINIHFILWVIIQCYFILLLKLFQLWPLEALSVVSYIPFTYSHHCEFIFCFSTFLISGTARHSTPILCISCPNLRIGHFWGALVPFIEEWY